MRSSEERRGLVLHHGQLVTLAGHPEDDDVVVALAGVRVEGVRTRVPEEDERLSAHLVDGSVLGAGVDADVGHAKGKVVHVLDPRRPAARSRHRVRLGVTVSARATSVCVNPPPVGLVDPVHHADERMRGTAWARAGAVGSIFCAQRRSAPAWGSTIRRRAVFEVSTGTSAAVSTSTDGARAPLVQSEPLSTMTARLSCP